jgi:2-C-methyl-D-erythritol 4-phosphate cytidylyltransferase
MLNLGIAFLLPIMEKNTHYIVIVAGGTGSRMANDLPKQFLPIHDKPIIIHTIERFLSALPMSNIIVVIHAAWKSYLSDLLQVYLLDTEVVIVDGGETRFHSVQNGLSQIPNDNSILVGIHDAARPLVSVTTIHKAFQSALEYGNGIPVIAIAESLRVIETDGNKAIDRSCVRIVQTPQCFQLPLIQQAFKQDYLPEFTDDASVIEKFGCVVHLTEGNKENIKITLPTDLKIAEALLSSIN